MTTAKELCLKKLAESFSQEDIQQLDHHDILSLGIEAGALNCQECRHWRTSVNRCYNSNWMGGKNNPVNPDCAGLGYTAKI